MNSFYEKVVVYTAIFGQKDNLLQPLNMASLSSGQVDFVCITDDPDLISTTYEIITVPVGHRNFTKTARYFKIKGLEEFEKYDLAIWHDAAMAIDCSSIHELVHFSRRFPLATFQHGETCLYKEAITCIELKKEDPITITKQVYRYFRRGVPINIGMYETGILTIRIEGGDLTKNIRDQWWEEVKKGSARDQLALGFIAYFKKVKIGILKGRGHNNQFSRYHSHNYNHYRNSSLKQLLNNYVIRKLCIGLIYRMRFNR